MSSFDHIVERLTARNAPSATAEDEGGLRAAVAAVLRPKGGPAVRALDDTEILFIRRAEREGDPWSGHMAFPGGRRQSGESLLTTATRETLEEVGLDLTDIKPVTRLPDLMPHTQMPAPIIVSAFVFALPEVPELVPNEEVAETLWAPLGPVLRREGATTYRFTREGFYLDLPALDVDGRIVWGLTYRMIEMLAECLA